jgi:hypothetical protein
MFFIYLRRELRRRMRQVIFISLGLAIGAGLVITVTAALTPGPPWPARPPLRTGHGHRARAHMPGGRAGV